MNRNHGPRRLLSAMVAIALISTVANVAAWSATPEAPTVLHGRATAADGTTPRPGAVVALSVEADGATWASAPAADDGTFRVEGAPEGTYALVVREGDRVYLAAERFPVRAGVTGPVELAVQPSLAPAQSGGGGIPTWGQWLIAGGIVIGGAFLVDEVVTDDTEPSASPF